MGRAINVPWQDILTILNTIDTAAGVLFLATSWFGFRAWLNSRAKARQDAVGTAGSQDKEEDASAR